MCRKSVCAVSAVLFMVLAGQASAELIGWWTFDDGAGTVAVDSSGKGHDAAVQGGAEWVEGKAGSGALSFDGSDDIVVAGETPLMDIDTALTAAAWVYLNNLNTYYFILDKSPSGTAPSNYPGNYEFRIAPTTGTIQFGHQTSQGIDYVFYDSTTPIKAGRWYHVAVTFTKGGTVKFYVDGAPAGSVPQTQTFGILNDEPVRIGGRKDGYSFFSGMLDDVRLYNHALKDLEVKKLAARPKAYDPQPPNGATGVLQPLLQWTSGTFAQWHEVYFGTTPGLTQADFKTRQMQMITMYWYPAGLTPGQTYYWRVDEVEPNQAVHTGDLWSFTAAPTTAFAPTPRNGDKWIDPNADLSWQAGQGATKHDLYFGTDQAAVTARDAGIFKGSLFTTTYEPGTLAGQTTYYWAVDEVGAVKSPGEVWSFTTAGGGGGVRGEYFNNMTVSGMPVLSRIDPSIDFSWADPASPGTGISMDNFSARWTADLEIAVADTYTFITNTDDGVRLWLNDKRIINRWVDQSPTDSLSAPLVLQPGIYSLRMEYYENTSGAVARLDWQTPSMPRQVIPSGPLQPPVRAKAIYPKDNDVNIPQDVTLMWSTGEKAVTHEVYFGADEAAVAVATPADAAIYQGSQAVENNTFVPGALEWNKTYYWRVDEVNDASADSPWKGAVWSFTTADFIVVDDFESYVDEEVGRIFQSWIDGWGYTTPAPGNPGNGTGSTVGYTDAPFAERSIVHGGGQSMPFDYNNIIQPYYSETDRTFDTAANWKVNGVTDLVLWIQGYGARFIDDGTTITMSAAGDDIWNNADAFRFAYKKLNGDGSITAKVNSIVQTDVWAKAGVMIRESLTPGSANAANIVSAASGVSFQYRNFTDDVSANVGQGSLAAPYWVRLTRTGNTMKAEMSADGKTWSIIGTDAAASSHDVVMGSSLYIGLCVTSHNTNAKIATTGVFSDVKTTGGVSGQWQVAEIGMVHPGNDPAQLYVALQDSAGKVAVVNHADLNAVLTSTWTQWEIPLSAFTGVNLGSVKKMYIGVGDRKAPQAGGHGKLFIDDIRVVK